MLDHKKSKLFIMDHNIENLAYQIIAGPNC